MLKLKCLFKNFKAQISEITRETTPLPRPNIYLQAEKKKPKKIIISTVADFNFTAIQCRIFDIKFLQIHNILAFSNICVLMKFNLKNAREQKNLERSP